MPTHRRSHIIRYSRTCVTRRHCNSSSRVPVYSMLLLLPIGNWQVGGWVTNILERLQTFYDSKRTIDLVAFVTIWANACISFTIFRDCKTKSLCLMSSLYSETHIQTHTHTHTHTHTPGQRSTCTDISKITSHKELTRSSVLRRDRLISLIPLEQRCPNVFDSRRPCWIQIFPKALYVKF
jgi:hypothetical protein